MAAIFALTAIAFHGGSKVNCTSAKMKNDTPQ
jgi:hypothetical protein